MTKTTLTSKLKRCLKAGKRSAARPWPWPAAPGCSAPAPPALASVASARGWRNQYSMANNTEMPKKMMYQSREAALKQQANRNALMNKGNMRCCKFRARASAAGSPGTNSLSSWPCCASLRRASLATPATLFTLVRTAAAAKRASEVSASRPKADFLFWGWIWCWCTYPRSCEIWNSTCWSWRRVVFSIPWA